MAEKNTEARWYVAHTYSGYENKVKMDFRGQRSHATGY